jgi:hydroxymethylglutaryl-CoA reductase
LSDSRIADFYRLSLAERVRLLADRGMISAADADRLLSDQGLLPADAADKMIENVIGVFGLPLAIAPNFLVNKKDYVAPMVVEEPSIVAGVSGAAKLIREAGGFSVRSTNPVLIGQIQIIDVAEPDDAIRSLRGSHDEILRLANELQPKLLERGGGAQDIEYFKFQLPDGRWTVVLHLLVDTRDAMGANAVNTICEGLAPQLEKICGGTVFLKIVSNLTDRSVVSANAKIPPAMLGRDGFSGEQIRDSIVLANDFANTSPYRAATHNKGIMNGIDAVALATGNDWRSLEAGAHANAMRDVAYLELTSRTVGDNGDLLGNLTMPIKVGIVGGSQTSNPAAATGLRITGAKSGQDLAELMGAVGLAQNFAALRALVTDGIQKGHMNLHARSVAAAAGAPEEIFDQVVAGMVESGDVKPWKAEELIGSLQESDDDTTKIPVLDLSESVPPGTVVPPVEKVVPKGQKPDGVAAGKVILLGEHAAVYDRNVLALPIESAVAVRIVETAAGIRLLIPDWKIEQQLDPDAPVRGGPAAVMALIRRYFGVTERGFDIHVRSRIPFAAGLGFSAALAVASIRAFDKIAGKGMSNVEVEKLAFQCEKITHGAPSGIDNNIATFGQPVLFSKGTRSRTKPITLTEVPPLVIAASGIRASTIEQVAGVRERYDNNRELYTTIFDEMGEISIAGAVALRTCDYDQLGAMMNVCQGFLNAIEVSTPELEKMIAIARQNGAVGAKLTGAGGGGSIVALCPGKVSNVTRALEAAGYQIVKMQNGEETYGSADRN